LRVAKSLQAWLTPLPGTKSDAIRHHLDVFSSARNYDPLNAGAADLMVFRGPIDPALVRLQVAIPSSLLPNIFGPKASTTSH
jgi:hypothetical protein